MKILVTGGAGFIGSHVAEALVARGDQVLIIDNLEMGKQEWIPVGAEFVKSDLNDRLVWPMISEFEPEAILHAAAAYKKGTTPKQAIETNGIVSTILGLYAEKKGAKLVYCQTALVYGNPATIPTPVSAPFSPQCLYAKTKLAGELGITASGCRSVIFRKASVYGPRNLTGPIPIFYDQIKNGKLSHIAQWSSRQFVFIDDVVPYYVEALHNNAEGIFNLAFGPPVLILDLWKCMLKLFGDPMGANYIAENTPEGSVLTINLERSHVMDFWGMEHGKNPLGETSLVYGLEKTISWYDQHPPEKTETHFKRHANV